MVTLTSDVVAAGTRIGQFVRFYGTVAEMLASTRSVSTGQTIKAGPHSYQVAASDATDHHLTRDDGTKLYVQEVEHGLDVRAFGALCDGSTDDTAALILAMVAADTANTSIFILGSMVFDPSQITFTARPGATWYLQGELRPTTTLVVDSFWNLIGIGGAARMRWLKNSTARIVPPPGNIATVELVGEANQLIKNITIEECYDGISIRDGATGLSAFVTLENVGIRTSLTGRHALRIESLFWGWFRNCGFTGRNKTDPDAYTVRILGGTGATGYVGLVQFTDCISSGRGFFVDGPDIRSLLFKDHTHESLPEGDYLYKIASQRAHFINSMNADPEAGSLGAFQLAGTQLALIEGITNPIPRDNLPDRLSIIPHTYDHGFSPAFTNLWDRPTYMGGQDGLIYGRMSNRVFAPFISSGVVDTYTCGFETGTGLGEDQTVTATSVLAPDGTTTAVRAESVGGGSGGERFFSSSTPTFSLEQGDTVIAGCLMKPTDPDNLGGSINLWIPGLKFQTLTGFTSDLPGGPHYVHYTGNSNYTSGLLYEGGAWVATSLYYHLHECTGTISTDAKLSLELSKVSDAANNSLIAWRPWVSVLKASDGYTLADALKLLSALSVQEALPAGSTGTLSHHAFFTGRGATANRPTGQIAGAQWYDTTLGKPIWFDGTNWTDAAGTTV